MWKETCIPTVVSPLKPNHTNLFKVSSLNMTMFICHSASAVIDRYKWSNETSVKRPQRLRIKQNRVGKNYDRGCLSEDDYPGIKGIQRWYRDFQWAAESRVWVKISEIKKKKKLKIHFKKYHKVSIGNSNGSDRLEKWDQRCMVSKNEDTVLF